MRRLDTGNGRGVTARSESILDDNTLFGRLLVGTFELIPGVEGDLPRVRKASMIDGELLELLICQVLKGKLAKAIDEGLFLVLGPR